MTQIISSFQQIAPQYDVAFVDLWGCMHDGITAFEAANAAMSAFRAAGGCVVLVTNSPRPASGVELQLEAFGVERSSFDLLVTSGDASRFAMFSGIVGEKLWFVGEDSDSDFMQPFTELATPKEISLVPLEEAEGIVCCGPRDVHADPEVYRSAFLYAKQKGLKLLCANPDIMVDRGERREWCAGALARLYTHMGGESLYFGKPHPSIYDLARLRLQNKGVDVQPSRVICIGDGIQTDILGAQQENLDSLFITGGLALEETQTQEQPDAEALAAYTGQMQVHPTYAIGYLR